MKYIIQNFCEHENTYALNVSFIVVYFMVYLLSYLNPIIIRVGVLSHVLYFVPFLFYFTETPGIKSIVEFNVR